jgi:ABC-2 type transport system permease protein
VKELAIAGTNLRRTFRQRSTIFFLVLFPMLMILILGVAFGGSFEPRVGMIVPPSVAWLGTDVKAAPGINVVTYTDERAMIGAVERGELAAGLVLPADLSQAVRYIARPGLQGQQVASIIAGVLDREAARLRAATFVQTESGLSRTDALAKVDAVAAALTPTAVTVTTGETSTAPAGRFDQMASAELILFVFLVAMTGSVALIESRRLGVTRRMAATPTSSGTIIRGEAIGRLSLSLIQAAIIMTGSALIFQVDWGNPIAAATLIVAFSLVASATGLLMGTLVRSPELAIGIGLLLALGMAALGGAMMPLEFFSPTMQKVAHLTPHAWAIDGFTQLTRHGGGVADILTELGVLTGAAAVLFVIASWALRRRLSA